MVARPIVGGRACARGGEFFRRATRALARRPQFARALVRAMATGDSDTAVKIAAFQLRITGLIAAALRGVAPALAGRSEADRVHQRDAAVAQTLMHVWFSSLVGWSAGLRTERVVVEEVRTAAKLILDAGER